MRDPSLTWTDADERRSKRKSRFSVLERTLLSIMALAVLAAGAAYSLDRAKHAWGHIASSSNLRQIGMGLKMYAESNDGELPVDWANLITAKGIEITGDVFSSPFSDYDDSRRSLSKASHAKLIATPGSFNCSYMLVAGGLRFSDLDDSSVLAIEPAEVNDGKGAQLLFRDLHVDWFALKDGSPERQAYDRLIADFSNGVRPVRWQLPTTSAATQP